MIALLAELAPWAVAGVAFGLMLRLARPRGNYAGRPSRLPPPRGVGSTVRPTTPHPLMTPPPGGTGARRPRMLTTTAPRAVLIGDADTGD